MVHTSHAGLYSLAGIIAANALTQVCGHPIDLTMINIPALTASIAATFLDIKKRWNDAPTVN